MIDPWLCSAKIGVFITVGKVLRNFSKKEPIFELNFHSLLSKFNELSENHPKFWIISLLDREIRDLVRGPQKKLKIIEDKIGKFEMSRTTTKLEMVSPKTCCAVMTEGRSQDRRAPGGGLGGGAPRFFCEMGFQEQFWQ